ncbi:MAG: hypothetical protein ACKVP5_14165 [Aestuariivirga sp.]
MTRNRDALIRIVASLFAMLGLADGVSLGRIPRALNKAVLRILLPAESAVRRLIIAAARGMVAKPGASRPMPKGTKIAKGTGKGRARRASFNLSDRHEPWLPPRNKWKPPPKGPRISSFGHDPTWPAALAHSAELFRFRNNVAPEPGPAPKPKREDDGCVDSMRLTRRLQAIMFALADIPHQAKRFVRWKATRERQADAGKLVRTEPLRDGDPPGYRHPFRHEVDEVLDECIWLAGEAAKAARKIDSS